MTIRQYFDKNVTDRSRKTADVRRIPNDRGKRMAPFLMFVLENKLTLEGVDPKLKLFTDVPAVEHLSVSGAAVVAPGYAEMYLGPTWSPSKTLSLGVAAGIETAEDPWRVAGTVTVSHDKFWGIGIVEYGGSGLWYKGLATYRVGLVSFGALAERFDGIGPRIGVSYKGFELSAAPLFDFEAKEPKGLVALSWKP